jgi:CRISPR-associated protein Csx14
MVTEKAVLISTLGTEPQVVTLSLYQLLAQQVPITRAVILYSQGDDPALEQAVLTLRDAWGELPYHSLVEPLFSQIRMQDVVSEDSVKVAYREIRHWIHQHKSRGWTVYLNISGGRKPMTVCAFIAAQLLFGLKDHLLYLVSSQNLVSSRQLIGDPSQFHLIELPVPRWSEELSILSALASDDDPWVAADIQRQSMHREESRRWTTFIQSSLTTAERRVVQELVARGGTNVDIASRINRSTRTVGHQVSSAFRKVKLFMDLPLDTNIDRATLVSLLAQHIRQDDLQRLGQIPDVKKHGDHYHNSMRR